MLGGVAGRFSGPLGALSVLDVLCERGEGV
jgi:hypothetical protein